MSRAVRRGGERGPATARRCERNALVDARGGHRDQREVAVLPVEHQAEDRRDEPERSERADHRAHLLAAAAAVSISSSRSASAVSRQPSAAAAAASVNRTVSSMDASASTPCSKKRSNADAPLPRCVHSPFSTASSICWIVYLGRGRGVSSSSRQQQAAGSGQRVLCLFLAAEQRVVAVPIDLCDAVEREARPCRQVALHLQQQQQRQTSLQQQQQQVALHLFATAARPLDLLVRAPVDSAGHPDDADVHHAVALHG